MGSAMSSDKPSGCRTPREHKFQFLRLLAKTLISEYYTDLVWKPIMDKTEIETIIRKQEQLIFFGTVKEAETQMKTYFLSPHMLDTETLPKDLKYNNEILFELPIDAYLCEDVDFWTLLV